MEGLRWYGVVTTPWPSWYGERRLGALSRAQPTVGLIWLDAHADMNTPDTSPSGNIHGMPLACLLGMGPAELTDLRGYRPMIEAVEYR